MSAASRPARCRRTPPPSSRKACYIDNFKLVDRGRFREKELNAALTGAKYPARNPVQNVNDLKAQIAANEKGVQELRKMVAQFTMPVVQAYMQHVQDNAAESVRRVIDRLHDFEFSYEMDQGTVIKVKITVDKKKREATVDFTGTSPQQPTNFNAPEPVTRAAVLYVFRVMVDDDIPMNAGCLRPINIVIPKKSMLTPEYPAAVVAGNVETSQAVTNCLFGALGAIACAQGTMNNVNFGNEKYQYYETICSGSPAGPGFPGTDAVHTHMTNTRLTDPEMLEFRYPVVLEDFHIRKGSGGRGQVECRRRHPPHHPLSRKDGMHATDRPPRACRPSAWRAARPGQVGENWARRKDGTMERLEGCDDTVIDAGEARHHPDSDRGRIREAGLALRHCRSPANLNEFDCIKHIVGAGLRFGDAMRDSPHHAQNNSRHRLYHPRRTGLRRVLSGQRRLWREQDRRQRQSRLPQGPRHRFPRPGAHRYRRRRSRLPQRVGHGARRFIQNRG